MFCKNCGKEIENDSKFCPKCGAKQKDESNNVEESKYDNPTNVLKICIWLAISALLIILFIGIAFFDTCENISCKGCDTVFSREATIEDLEIDTSINIDGIYLQIHAQENIEDLEITVKIYSSDNNLLKTESIEIGYVSKGNVYTKKLSFSGLDFSEILRASYVKCSVTQGTIKK